MITIREIASYVPTALISNIDRAQAFGMDDAFVRQKLGIHDVSRKQEDEETSDLCVKAFRALESKTDVRPEDIDLLLVCSQNPDGHGIPHTSAIVHGALQLPENCAAFDIGLGCSGYVYSLSIAASFMEANNLRKGLIFTSDPYSKILDPEDRTTEMLFGDAATVTLLESGTDHGDAWLPFGFKFGTRGRDGDALCNASGHLRMNGRAVFNFSATAVPEQVLRATEDQQIDIKDVDLFLFHQGSKYIVDTLAKRLELPAEKVPSNLSSQGNTISSSIPLLFEKKLHDPSIGLVLMSGFGVGLSWATCLARRT